MKLYLQFCIASRRENEIGFLYVVKFLNVVIKNLFILCEHIKYIHCRPLSVIIEIIVDELSLNFIRQ